MTSTALPDEVRGDATVPGGTLADAPQRRRRPPAGPAPAPEPRKGAQKWNAMRT